MEITYELEKEDIIKGEQGTGNRRFYFEEKKIKNCKLMIFFLLRVPENEIASLHSQRFAILYLTGKGNAIAFPNQM